MTTSALKHRVLSLYPNSNGLCYALFEGDLRPVDWGIKTARQRKDSTLIRHASQLIGLFTPATIVLPTRIAVAESSRRLHRIAIEIERVSSAANIAVHWYSRSDIKVCFSKFNAQTKDAIAAAIARLLPEFEQHVPPLRRLWMSEDYRMGLFDAVALAMTCYQVGELKMNRVKTDAAVKCGS